MPRWQEGELPLRERLPGGQQSDRKDTRTGPVVIMTNQEADMTRLRRALVFGMLQGH